RAESPFAQIRRQQIQARTFGQLEEACIAVKVLLVFCFEQSGAREQAIGFPDQAASPSVSEAEAVPPYYPVPQIHASKLNQLLRREFEPIRLAGIADPIEAEVGRNNAAAGDGRDVCDLR